jgi:hypothetical protein
MSDRYKDYRLLIYQKLIIDRKRDPIRYENLYKEFQTRGVDNELLKKLSPYGKLRKSISKPL